MTIKCRPGDQFFNLQIHKICPWAYQGVKPQSIDYRLDDIQIKLKKTRSNSTYDVSHGTQFNEPRFAGIECRGNSCEL